MARFWGVSVPEWKAALRNPRLVATVIVVLGGLTIYTLNYPGSMEYDSFVQWLEGRSGSYGYWHPPVMSWILGVFDTMPGPVAGWFTGMDMLLVFGALAALLWLPKRVSWAAACVAAAMLVLPQLVLIEAVVWKDTLFADAALVATVLIGLAVKFWPARRWRLALLGAASLFLALAVLTRQNGIVILPCLATGLAIAVRQCSGNWRMGAAYGAGVFALTGGLALAGNAALQLRWDGVPSQEQQFKVLRLYDISGMLRRDPRLKLTVMDREAPELARLIRTRTVRLWSPAKSDTMEIAAVNDAIVTIPASVYAKQWRASVAERPGLYLKVRGEIFRWVFQPPDVGLCHPFHVGNQPGEEPLEGYVIVRRMDAHDIALKHYGEFFLWHTPVFSHALFALLGLGVLVLLIRRRAPADIVLASLIVADFVFTATFFVISIACDYRYLFLIDLTSIASLLYVAADWRGLLGPQKRGREAPFEACHRGELLG